MGESPRKGRTMALINAYDELVTELSNINLSISDIDWVSDSYCRIPEQLFIDEMKATDYDNGYGGVELPCYVVMLKDGTWFERAEYDGSEWWVHRSVPTCPTKVAPWCLEAAYNSLDLAIEQAEYEEFLADLAEYEAAMCEERMDALYDEIESDLDHTNESGKWSGYTGKCATKARCKRFVYSERRYELGGGSWAKPNSRCWKDQRGKGRNKRDTQHRVA